MPAAQSIRVVIFLALLCVLALAASARSGQIQQNSNRDEYIRRINYENDFLNQRLTWLLTSQGLLFASYGVVLNAKASEQVKERVARTAITLGACSALLIWLGLIAAIASIGQLSKESGQKDLVVWQWTNILGWSVPLLLPLLFIGSWLRLPAQGSPPQIRQVDHRRSNLASRSNTAGETRRMTDS